MRNHRLYRTPYGIFHRQVLKTSMGAQPPFPFLPSFHHLLPSFSLPFIPTSPASPPATDKESGNCLALQAGKNKQTNSTPRKVVKQNYLHVMGDGVTIDNFYTTNTFHVYIHAGDAFSGTVCRRLHALWAPAQAVDRQPVQLNVPLFTTIENVIPTTAV